MSFKNNSEWNQKNELKALLIFKRLYEIQFKRGKQMEFCKQMEQETTLSAGNISAKVSNYKSVAGINNKSNASKDTIESYLKYKNYSIQELEYVINKM